MLLRIKCDGVDVKYNASVLHVFRRDGVRNREQSIVTTLVCCRSRMERAANKAPVELCEAESQEVRKMMRKDVEKASMDTEITCSVEMQVQWGLIRHESWKGRLDRGFLEWRGVAIKNSWNATVVQRCLVKTRDNGVVSLTRFI